MAILINKQLRILPICIHLLLITGVAWGQKSDPIYPEVGKRMPDFNLTDVKYYNKKKVVLNDFKGQWLILDFFGAHCGSCLEALPKTDSLQRIFKRDLKILLVGYTGSQYVKKSDNILIRKTYERNRRMGRLDLSIAYDSVLVRRFDIWTVPYIVVIDPNGIVKGITYKINEQNIRDLLAGKEVSMPTAYRDTERRKRIKEKYGKQ